MVWHRFVFLFFFQTGAIRQPDTTTINNKDAAKQLQEYRKVVKADYALERRRYEVHSRIRFNHRGQVAMALDVTDDDENDDQTISEMQPQFFITLEEASFLDGKHVFFGTCSGPTFFIALRIGQVEVDESTHRPVDFEHAPRVTAVRILD